MDDLKRGDVVEFNGNPFDEQLGEYRRICTER